jgi:hypothetical protein
VFVTKNLFSTEIKKGNTIMKKILSLLLAGLMMVSVVACTTDTPDATTTTPAASTTTVKTTTQKTTHEQIERPDDMPEDWILLESQYEWHYKTFVCPFNRDADPQFDPETDEMAKWLAEKGEEWYKDPAVLADMATWPKATAPMGDRYDKLGDGNSPIGWGGDTHGLICYATFELTAEQMEWVAKAELNDIYMNVFYDNAFYLYINGELVFFEDANGGEGDWNESQEPVDFMDGVDIRTILKEGENTVVAKLKDCWGGREFLFGLECVYSY